MTTTDELAAEPFSTVVRSLSQADHQRSESVPFLTALTEGSVPLIAYARMVAQHRHIYPVIEAAAAALRDDPQVTPFLDDHLIRLPSIEADLRDLPAADLDPTPATTRYVDRLREVCFTWPAGFVAHHYTRYLGDLSGGPFIAAAIRRAYGLTGTAGTSFYVFAGLGSPARFKARYRQALDDATWPADEQRRFVDEVHLAYRFNTEVLLDLGAEFGR